MKIIFRHMMTGSPATNVDDQSILPRSISINDSSNDSFLNGTKKCVKRKLDFDSVSKDSGTNSSFIFSQRNLSLRDFQSKKSGFDTPGKRKINSFRSSIGSGSSVRRKLFFDDNDGVVLSTKKKFPGSRGDQSRSGLLLNLAYTNYNLSSGKKDSPAFRFADGSLKSSAKKTQIRGEDKSPVFKVAKNAKCPARKLFDDESTQNDVVSNLEERSVGLFKKRLISSKYENNNNNRSDVLLFKNTSRDDIKTELRESVADSQKSEVYDDAQMNNSINNTVNTSGISEKIEHNDLKRTNNESSPAFPTSGIIKTPRSSNIMNTMNNTPRSNKLNIRSSLRDKIMNLSKCSTVHSNNNNSSNDNLNITSDSSKMSPIFKSNNCLHAKSIPIKSNWTNANNDLIEHCKKDAHKMERLNSTFAGMTSSIKTGSVGRKWVSDSFNCSDKVKCCKSGKSKVPFIVSHLNRFLNDCINELESKKRIGSPTFDATTNSQSKSSDSNASQKNTRKRRHNHALPLKESLFPNEWRTKEGDSVNESIKERPPIKKLRIKVGSKLNSTLNEDYEVKKDSKANFEKFSNIFENPKKIVIDDDISEDEPRIDNIVITNDTPSSKNSSKLTAVKKFDTATPIKNVVIDEAPVSEKKGRKKKLNSDALSVRLQTLINREKSDRRFWEYELSRKTHENCNRNNNGALFRVEKMWLEFNNLILLCSTAVNKQVQVDMPVYLTNGLNGIGVNFKDSAVVIIDKDACPKNLTFRSKFLIYPPWRIIQIDKTSEPIILRPTEIELLENTDNELLNSESFSFSSFPISDIKGRVILDNEYFTCSCGDKCKCEAASNRYAIVMKCMFDFDKSPSIMETKLKLYHNFENMKTFNDVILQHRLCPDKIFSLNLQLQYSYLKKGRDNNGMSFMICTNDEAEMCCIFVEDGYKNITNNKNSTKLKISGLVPWKFISSECVNELIKCFKTDKEKELIDVIQNKSIYLFTLSAKDGSVEYIYEF